MLLRGIEIQKRQGDMNIIDAKGGAIVPGFVDSHTHLIWGGDRSNEMALRQKGLSYSDISKMGGGISKTCLLYTSDAADEP